MSRHEAGAEYDGPATLVVAGDEVRAEVVLRGVFQPIDGRFHWYGRVAPTEELADAAGRGVLLRTTHGEAQGRLSDVDPWGRLRVAGTGRPPF